MKKTLFGIALLALLLSTCAVAQDQAQMNYPAEWFQHPFMFFPHPFFPFPGGPGNFHLPTLPPMPSPAFKLPPPNGDQSKCFQALHDPSVGQCLESLRSFFQSHKLSSTCCSTIGSIQTACQAIPPQLSSVLKNINTQFCSTSPSPPTS